MKKGQERFVNIERNVKKGKGGCKNKKRINLITIFIITLFFISIIAVSIPFAKTQQRTPLPDSQQPPPSRPEEIQRAQKPKSEFWDLAVDHCIINGEFVDINPCDLNSGKSISVKVGQIVNFKCYYKIITIPVGNITKADAAYWGSGKFTFLVAQYVFTMGLSKIKKTTVNKRLPRFTYEDVQKWKKSMKSMGRKTWTRYMTSHWTATMDHVGKLNLVNCDLQPNGFEETSK